MSNVEVARFMLDHGLSARGVQGVVYLDELDRKMVLGELSFFYSSSSSSSSSSLLPLTVGHGSRC
jgi:hypothetical protein